MTTASTTISVKGLMTGVENTLQPFMALIDGIADPAVATFKKSMQQVLDDAGPASGPIAAALFNRGLESIPGIKLIAPAIEVIADPIVSTVVSSAVKSAEDEVKALNEQAVTGSPLKPAGS